MHHGAIFGWSLSARLTRVRFRSVGGGWGGGGFGRCGGGGKTVLGWWGDMFVVGGCGLRDLDGCRGEDEGGTLD